MEITEWKLQLNVAGIPLFTPGAGIDRIPQGVYEAKVLKSVQIPNKDASKCDNVRFDFELTDAKEKGKKTSIWLPVDMNVGKGLNGQKWKNLLAAVAKDPSVLEKGAVNLGPKNFEGKTAYLHVQEVPGKNEKGQDNLPNVSPITKDQYQQFKTEGYGAVVGGAQSNGTTATMTVTGGAPAGAVPQVAAEVTLD